MLKSYVGYTNAINAFVNSKQHQFHIDDFDWNIAFKVMNYLKPFYKATKTSFGVYYPTSNLLLLQFVEIANQFSSHKDDPFFYDIVCTMKDKFQNYCENMPMIFPIVAVMDPRIKFFGVQCAMNQLSETLSFNINITSQAIECFINDMHNNYVMKYGNNETLLSPTSSATNSKGKSSFFSLITKKRNVSFTSSISSFSNENITPAELEIYYQFDHYSLIPQDEIDNLDILQRWKVNERSYPIL